MGLYWGNLGFDLVPNDWESDEIPRTGKFLDDLDDSMEHQWAKTCREGELMYPNRQEKCYLVKMLKTCSERLALECSICDSQEVRKTSKYGEQMQ